MRDVLKSLDRERPVLIAGPTASGKSALALEIAEFVGGPVVNADALQIFSDWRILTARPPVEDEARHPHTLYGHVPGSEAYSVGRWLRDVSPLLAGPPPVIVGGTGLYFKALTEGLAEIPETPDVIRAEAMERIAAQGAAALLAELDGATAARIDRANPMRIQRAWEVQAATGRGLASWQDETGPPLLALGQAQPLLIDAPKGWLTPRIERRFLMMLDAGLLEEALANSKDFDPGQPSSKAIGASEMVAHVTGKLRLEDARETVVTATRQYAKRQRSWFRARMRGWRTIATC